MLDDSITLAALQMIPSSSLSNTVTTIDDLITLLLEQGHSPDCVVLPEYCFGTLYEWQLAGVDRENQHLKIREEIARLSQKHRVTIVAGSMPYRTPEGRWRNRSLLVSPKGLVVGEYDKQRPFRMEKKLGLEPGRQTPVFEVNQLRLAILLCADLWSARLVQQVATQVDVLAVPTMTTVLGEQLVGYGRWAWQSLVGVRAKEFTVPIVSADQAIRTPVPGVFTCGASCIADPSHRFSTGDGPGTQALKAVHPTSCTVLVSTMAKNQLDEYRRYRRDVGLLD